MPFWNLNNDYVQLALNGVSARLQLDDTVAGLQQLKLGADQVANCDLLNVDVRELPNEQGETYVRGDDLIRKLPERASDQVRHEVYYRATGGDGVTGDPAGIEMILSAQTNLLDSRPSVEVSNTFGSGDLLLKTSDDRPATSAITRDFDVDAPLLYAIHRPDEAPATSMVLLVHPSDFYLATSLIEPQPRISFSVFPNSLEKGVIRRAYFQLRFVARVDDLATAEQLLESVASMEPPLTA